MPSGAQAGDDSAPRSRTSTSGSGARRAGGALATTRPVSASSQRSASPSSASRVETNATRRPSGETRGSVSSAVRLGQPLDGRGAGRAGSTMCRSHCPPLAGGEDEAPVGQPRRPALVAGQVVRRRGTPPRASTSRDRSRRADVAPRTRAAGRRATTPDRARGRRRDPASARPTRGSRPSASSVQMLIADGEGDAAAGRRPRRDRGARRATAGRRQAAAAACAEVRPGGRRSHASREPGRGQGEREERAEAWHRRRAYRSDFTASTMCDGREAELVDAAPRACRCAESRAPRVWWTLPPIGATAFIDRVADAAGRVVILDGDDPAGLRAPPAQRLGVDRLQRVEVDDADVDALRLQRVVGALAPRTA